MRGEGEQSGLATEKEWLAFTNGWIEVCGKLVISLPKQLLKSRETQSTFLMTAVFENDDISFASYNDDHILLHEWMNQEDIRQLATF